MMTRPLLFALQSCYTMENKMAEQPAQHHRQHH